MLDELRDRVTSFLSRNHICVICTSGSLGAWAVLAQYDNAGLILNCHLPRWSDAAFYLEQEPHVIVIILDVKSEQLQRLQYRGIAQVTDSTDDRFVTVHITPKRIDLVDESKGWGAFETLEM